MEEELLKMVYDYSKTGKIVDKEFIDKLVHIVVCERKLQKFLKDYSFNEGINPAGGPCTFYNPSLMNVEVYYESVINYINELSLDVFNFTNFELIMFKNLVITHIMLHELEHVNQNKISYDDSDKSDEAMIIRGDYVYTFCVGNEYFVQMMKMLGYSEKDLINFVTDCQALYNKYYEFSPAERLADINAGRTIVKMLAPIKELVPDLYYRETKILENYYYRGYEKAVELNSCPTEIYLNALMQEDIWQELSFYDKDPKVLYKNSQKYSLNKRLALGLPFDDSEFFMAQIIGPSIE